MSAFVITVNSTTLKTLRPDGTTINTWSPSGPFYDNAIGERKKMTHEITLNQSLNGATIYFVPANVIQSGTPYIGAGNAPANAFVYSFTSAPTVGTYPMVLQCQSGYIPDIMKNWEAEIEIDYDSSIQIHFYFYEIYDTLTYLSPVAQDNHSKLLKDNKNNPSELVISGPSKYNTGSYLYNSYIFVQSNSIPADKGYIFTEQRYLAGFYNKSVLNGSPYFSDPVWGLERSAASVTNLSVYTDTKIIFDCVAPGDVVDEMLLWAIRTDSTDNTVDFLTNYESSFAQIGTVAGSTTIDNKLKGPSTAPASIGSSRWRMTAHIDKSQLVIGEKYRFIAVVYRNSGGTYKVTSFISDEYTVSAYPTWTGNEAIFEGSMEDYNNRYTGKDLTCIVEERIRATMTINHANFATEIYNRLGITLPNSDLRRYLTQVDAVIYHESTSGGNTTRQILDEGISYKISPISYTAVQRMSQSFGTTSTTLKWLWRNRYESWMSNIRTLYNGVALPSPTGTQNWADLDLVMEFALHFIYDDYSTPFEDVVRYRFKFKPVDYIKDSTFKIETQDASLEDDVFFCIQDGKLCLRAKHSATSVDDYNLIVTIEPIQGNAFTVEEAEAYSDILTQFTTLKITNEDTLYSSTATIANFCVDVDQLVPGTTYKIAAMRKKVNI